MKLFPTIARSLALATLLVTGASQASILYSSTNQSLTAGDPTQLGRPSRGGTGQDWFGTEQYQGIVNPATAVHYRTITFNVGVENFLEISVDDPLGLVFVSAYQGLYNPLANRALGWLGDNGSSGNGQFGDPRFFQVVANQSSFVTLVVNEITTNGGIGAPFGIVVQGFLNTDRDELDPNATAVPEPSTIALSLVGLLGIAAFRRRQARQGGSTGLAVAA